MKKKFVLNIFNNNNHSFCIYKNNNNYSFIHRFNKNNNNKKKKFVYILNFNKNYLFVKFDTISY